MNRRWTNLRRSVRYLTSLNPEQITLAAEFADPECTQARRAVDVVFPLGITLHALSKLPAEVQSAQSSARLAAYAKHLAGQGLPFSFNYWTRESPLQQTESIPDDIDDTACGLAALHLAGEEIDPRYFLKAVKIESQPGGPYYTWYVNHQTDPEQRWQDIDPVVNAHFLYFAKLYGIALPRTEEYLLNQIEAGQIASRYYPYDLIFWLYFCKYVSVERSSELTRLAEAKLNQYSHVQLAPLEKILHCLCLAYLDLPMDPDWLSEIEGWVGRDGSLPPLPMCYGFSFGNNTHTFCGNKANSTALYIELCSLANKPKALKSSTSLPTDSFVSTLRTQVVADLKAYEIDNEAANIDKQVTPRAFVLPLLLAGIAKSKLDKEDLHNVSSFSLAMFWYWHSYTLLDKVIDAEPHTFSEALITFSQHLGDKYLHQLHQSHPQLIDSLFTSLIQMDRHYIWEATHLRRRRNPQAKATDYAYIAERMRIFTTALGMVPQLVGNTDQALATQLSHLFEQLILIEQLNDDAHDWEEDLANGIVTYVTSQMRKVKKAQRDAYFWKHILPEIMRLCTKHKELAEQALGRLEKAGYKVERLQQLIEKSFAPIHTAITEKENTTKLINSLENTSG